MPTRTAEAFISPELLYTGLWKPETMVHGNDHGNVEDGKIS